MSEMSEISAKTRQDSLTDFKQKTTLTSVLAFALIF